MSVAVENKRPMPKTEKQKLNAYPFYSPRFWHGMRFSDFVSLVARNKFRIHPARVVMAGIVAQTAVVNSTFAGLQHLIYGRKIKETDVRRPPVFIVGHWRSGTTHLHELMSLDEQFAFCDTYECFAPNHFLVTGKVFPKLVNLLLPNKRPQDNMLAGVERPQEDEFALVAMGAPSPYTRMAFPNNPPEYASFYDMENVDPQELKRFTDAMMYFTKALTFKKTKRLLLKSPPHTGRIAHLAQMYPGARFIHIVRDPYSLFASTRRLWVALDEAQAFQRPKHEDLDEFVFSTFERIQNAYQKQREQIDPASLCELRYEDLIQNPLGEVSRIYEELNLSGFHHLQPKIEEYLEGQRSYKPNKHELSDEIRSQIKQRWSDYIERYGYDD